MLERTFWYLSEHWIGAGMEAERENIGDDIPLVWMAGKS